MTFRVLVTDRAWPDLEIERAILAEADAEVIEAPNGSEATLVELARDADAIAVCWAQVTDAVIRSAVRCRVISRFGIGLDNIAVDTATQLGIPVTYVPDYCVDEVADHTMALLLACARNIGFFHDRTKRGEYNLQAAPPMPRLRNCVLGLVGLGRIGRAVAARAHAFGMTVCAHTPSGNPYGTGCRMVEFDRILTHSDFISLHCPLNDQTRALLGSEQFQRMKRSACLINTSRGALVDQQALQRALDSDGIAGAALDVFEPEPPDLTQPLFQNSRVIVTPHAAFFSRESVQELRTRTSRQIVDVLQGRCPEHVVNPQISGNPR